MVTILVLKTENLQMKALFDVEEESGRNTIIATKNSVHENSDPFWPVCTGTHKEKSQSL